ncbi:response regulator [Brevundimonas vesicularis]|uniref:response regulator n=1 Tax=Brevundimonas vesicularis TaxID=41276 RepID=UPI0015732901|nr:response regulator [Brevundimonas vesicularis]NSX32778.1 response regulator [Brevundimonas vesicularis]
MSNSVLKRLGLALAVGALVLVLAFVGLEMRRDFERVRALRQETAHSYRAREELQTVFSLMQDAETGQRGYIISGNPDFLTPYQTAIRRLDRELPRLRAAYASDAAQSANIKDLEDRIADKLAAIREALDAHDQRGSEAGLAVVSKGEGKAAMDRIRVTIDRMTEIDARALAALTQRVEARSRATEMMVTSLFLSLIVVVAGATLLLVRYVATRRNLLAEVRATAARQEAIFDSAIDAILTLNPSGTIETMNAAAARMFGWSAEMLGRRDVSVLLETADRDDAGLMARIRAGGADATGGLVQEMIGRRRSGEGFPVDVAFSPLALPAGVHLVAVVRDITDRRRVEELKKQFVSTVSHELRTPLTSIAGSLGLLAGGAAGVLSERASRLIGIAHSNSLRLVRLINDILDVEKLESGQINLQLQPLDLRDVAVRSLDAVRGYADELGVSLELADGPSAPVLGDGDRLVQVVVNLLSNAAKFSPSNGTVEVVVIPEARIVRLSVRDYGPGVPEAFRARIFTKFAQADGSDTRQKGGTGLGLAIAKEIAERHGGRLWFESAPGDGATFHLDLPMTLDNSMAQTSDGPRLLIVEDDPDAAEVLRIMLAQDGFDAVIATSATAALEAVESETFAAILVDLQLPDTDGIGLIRALRERPETLETPVVVVSADVARGRARGRSLEVIDWLEKPFDQGRLRAAISAVLERLGRRAPIILHVDDDPDILQVTAETLSGIAAITSAVSLSQARQVLTQMKPDLVILDLGLPDGSGLELLPELGSGRSGVPVVVYSAQDMDGALSERVEAVLVKSSASLADLAHTVRRLTFTPQDH